MTLYNLPTSFSLEETFSFPCILSCSPSLCREDCEGEEGEDGEEEEEGEEVEVEEEEEKRRRRRGEEEEEKG